jgi:hypothetical protein
MRARKLHIEYALVEVHCVHLATDGGIPERENVRAGKGSLAATDDGKITVIQDCGNTDSSFSQRGRAFSFAFFIR